MKSKYIIKAIESSINSNVRKLNENQRYMEECIASKEKAEKGGNLKRVEIRNGQIERYYKKIETLESVIEELLSLKSGITGERWYLWRDDIGDEEEKLEYCIKTWHEAWKKFDE